MLALAGRMLGDHSLAEDVVQEAYTNIFLNLDKFEERANIKSWMHRIVVNQCLMALRKRSRASDQHMDVLLPEFDTNGCRIEDSWDRFETPESLLQSEEARARILAAIGSLPDKYRVVLLLRDIEEMSTSEVAEILEVSISNVKVRLHRGRSALKKLLEPMMRGESL